MNCETVREQLAMLLYGELSFDEEEKIEEHLTGCAACAAARAREQAMHAVWSAAETPMPAGLLARCRRDLGASVRESELRREHPAWYRKLGDFLMTPPLWMRPVGAVALLALGFGIARWQGPAASLAGVTGPAEQGQIARVRLVNHQPDGDVRVVYDETRQRELSGRLDDEPIRRLLVAASSDPDDPGVRVDSLEALTGHAQDDVVREALLSALRTDSNAAVRLTALGGLKRYAGDAETRRALCDVLLSDENAPVRIAAIDLLVQSREPEVAGVLQELLRHERDGYVRSRSQKALNDMKASVGTF